MVNLEAKYSPEDVAARCKITTRQARNLCRSVLGERTRYRLTQDEFDRVRTWHATWGYKPRHIEQKIKNTSCNVPLNCR